MEITQASYVSMPEVKISAVNAFDSVAVNSADLETENETEDGAEQSLELTSSVEIDMSPVNDELAKTPSLFAPLGGLALLAVGILVVFFSRKKR